MLTAKALRAKPKDPTEDDDPDDGSLKFDRLITASLRPDDPLAKRLLGTPVATANVLLKVTVPKRTGRKRKKGSLGPFVADRDGEANPAPSKSPYVKADTIFQCIRDNPTKYTATPVGVIDESHRFRSTSTSANHLFTADISALPDLQVASFRNKTMDEIKDNLMDLRCMYALSCLVSPANFDREQTSELQSRHDSRGEAHREHPSKSRISSSYPVFQLQVSFIFF